MSAAREELLERLFDKASALAPEPRAAFLSEACAADPDLRSQLDGLLTDAADAYDFVDHVMGPAVARCAGIALGDSRAVVDDDADALTGHDIAHFRVLEKLGGGAMGLVYKALDLKLDRTVALKFLPVRLGASEEAKQRFIQEAKAASALDHANICAIHEIGETDAGQLFIAMAYYNGETLQKKIRRGPLPIHEALGLFEQLADGLRRAHDAGIVHRDIKPANVVITDQGQVKIVDFGVAKMRGTEVTDQAAIGTVAYMSPEQSRGDAIDARSDIWSLGVVLYEMLTGGRPFRGESDQTLIRAIRSDEPTSIRDVGSEIPAGLAALTSRCLEKDLTRRYQSVGELLADLRMMEQGGAIEPTRVQRNRVFSYVGAAVLFGMLTLGGGVLLSRSETRGRSDHSVRSLAVLPVTDFTPDTAREEFAEGMTDLLINQLSQISGLRRVVSRSSVTQYAGTKKSSREIGRELGVDGLVEASVLREGERVRINVNLIGAGAERVLWSRSFERPMRDVLMLQREVAQAIAREVQVQLTPQEEARFVGAAPQVDPEAFALYLRASRLPNQPKYWLQRKVYLEQAIAKDSSFALAYAGVAVSYIMNTNEKAKAEWAIARALALDPSSSAAYDALGLLRMWVDWDWPAAEAALRRSMELNSHDARAHHELGMLFMRLGRCDESVVEERRAMFLEPSSSYYQAGIAEVYLQCRRYDEALREFQKALDLGRDSANVYWNLGEAYFHQGQYQNALTMYGKMGHRPPGWAYVPLGSRTAALQQIDSLRAKWAREPNGWDSWMLARLYTSLGNPTEAIGWLERAYEMRSGIVVYLKVEPHFDPIRGEPRFHTLLKEIGLDD